MELSQRWINLFLGRLQNHFGNKKAPGGLKSTHRAYMSNLLLKIWGRSARLSRVIPRILCSTRRLHTISVSISTMNVIRVFLINIGHRNRSFPAFYDRYWIFPSRIMSSISTLYWRSILLDFYNRLCVLSFHSLYYEICCATLWKKVVASQVQTLHILTDRINNTYNRKTQKGDLYLPLTGSSAVKWGHSSHNHQREAPHRKRKQPLNRSSVKARLFNFHKLDFNWDRADLRTLLGRGHKCSFNSDVWGCNNATAQL